MSTYVGVNGVGRSMISGDSLPQPAFSLITEKVNFSASDINRSVSFKIPGNSLLHTIQYSTESYDGTCSMSGQGTLKFNSSAKQLRFIIQRMHVYGNGASDKVHMDGNQLNFNGVLLDSDIDHWLGISFYRSGNRLDLGGIMCGTATVTVNVIYTQL